MDKREIPVGKAPMQSHIDADYVTWECPCGKSCHSSTSDEQWLVFKKEHYSHTNGNLQGTVTADGARFMGSAGSTQVKMLPNPFEECRQREKRRKEHDKKIVRGSYILGGLLEAKDIESIQALRRNPDTPYEIMDVARQAIHLLQNTNKARYGAK